MIHIKLPYASFHLAWERGLKCRYRSVTIVVRVSHLLGARVGIVTDSSVMETNPSHPEWVCGLKFRYYTEKKISTYVAPFLGARVEMQQILRETTSERSHLAWCVG